MRIIVGSVILELLFVVAHGLCPQIVPRSQWGALPASQRFPMPTPVPMITIHHSATRNCSTNADCEAIILSFQRTHMNDREWNDIAYSFLIGGDESNIYEGRGWGSSVQGTHPENFNNISYTICIIGTYEDELPIQKHLEMAQQLIECATELNYAIPHYNLTGHRDVYIGTACPGAALYDEISNWANWHGEISKGSKMVKLDVALKVLLLLCFVHILNKSFTL